MRGVRRFLVSEGMSKNIRHSSASLLVVSLVCIIGVAGCRRAAVADGRRQEIESIPGATAYSEGDSGQPALLLEAKEKLGRQDLAGAEEIYRRITVLEPRNVPGYIGLGSCRFLQGDLEGAGRHYRRALELDERSTMAAIGLGSVAARNGNYEEAEGFYLRALSIDQTNADAHWGAALACEASGKLREAKEHYRRFLQLAPDSGQAPSARAKLAELGMAHRQ
jgi:tetratricopeptide (TPR) repeat protein